MKMRKPLLHYYKIGERVTAFSTTRHGGVSTGAYGTFNINSYCGDSPEHVEANLLALADELHIAPDHIILPHQVHGVQCRHIDSDFFSRSIAERKQLTEQTDCVMTDCKGVCIGVSTADCIPILLYDAAHHAAAAIHAGWRGTLQRIAYKAALEMQRHYGSAPNQLLAVIGPGISLRNFEVGQEVYDQFLQQGNDMSRIAERYAKWHINLPLCNELQLIEAGVPKDHITQSGICTYERVSDFFSARRLGINSGRVYTAILLC